MSPGTRIVRIPSRDVGRFEQGAGEKLGRWQLADANTNTNTNIITDRDTKTNSSSSSSSSAVSESIAALQEAAQLLRTSDIPVAFPTETVYGLGADATRSAAVKGIYAAKGRPSDNPLIIHVCDLDMLRAYLRPLGAEADVDTDPIPAIYKPLIERFWPGPLTLLMPNPQPSRLAPEVTAGLPTFGVRMCSSPVAQSLIRLAGRPLAAPSANASTKPSPTQARHVLDDLDGRIDLILDGGSCAVGVESTVVDGLCSPPAVLRPGGVSMEELRSCPGWEGAVKAYKDASEDGTAGKEAGAAAPRAPGMKYKHYSPKARVVLYEAVCAMGRDGVVPEDLRAALDMQSSKAAASANGAGTGVGPAAGDGLRRVGVIRTRRWKRVGGLRDECLHVPEMVAKGKVEGEGEGEGEGETEKALYEVREGELRDAEGKSLAQILDINLGEDTRGIAQGLFSSLRELDRRGVDVIFVDGIGDGDDMAAAVMNRLRKAASEIRS